jgi:uncharacterized membrane protein
MESPAPVTRRQYFRDLTPGELYAVVTDFPAYPRLFKELKSVKVVNQEPDARRFRVEFRAEVVLSVRYVLDLVCTPETFAVDWTFVEGEIVRDSRGSWRFEPEGGGTWVEYKVALVLEAPLPRFVVKKATDALVALSLPAMFTALEQEARRRKGAS